MASSTTQTPTTSTVYQQSIPQELMPYATRLLGNAQDYYFGNPNTGAAPAGAFNYTGQQIANFSPMQLQAFRNIQQMQPSAATNQAMGLAGLAGTNEFTGDNVSKYMSPYIQNVINQQEQGAIRDYGRSLPGLGSQAAMIGGLGGSRSALMQSEANRNLQNTLAGIDAQGYQQAYQNAQNQYNVGNQNMLAASGLLGNLGQQQFQQAAGINTALLGSGSLQQQQEQNALNTSYQNAYNQWKYPQQAMSDYSSLLRNTPMGSGTQNTFQAPGSMIGQVAGLGLGLGSLFGALG